ncbi:MAG: bifunctional oligoribonuclease/PAP phosphatase NrnA [Clostridiales bacterium]|nr:bifunctional oligoribonuclease/PAP phosphatase NrnA [Clostridiales bacterium]
MEIDLQKCADWLKAHDDYVILTHAHPDGDTLGSGFALCTALRRLGKHANVLNESTIPAKYSYIYDSYTPQTFDVQHVVAVDIATESLLGGLQPQYAGKVDLCVDHHGSNTFYAMQSYVDPGSASCCEIIFALIGLLGVPVDTYIADCIYTGVSTDTGCFRFGNTTSNCFSVAAELIKKGAHNVMINRKMFETKTKTYAHLERLALEGMRFYYAGRLAIITVTQQMYAKTGSSEQETEALTPLTRQVEGTEIGITLREKKDGTCKASIRTYESVDASKLAACFGGGGHKEAAACNIAADVETATDMLVRQCGAFLK